MQSHAPANRLALEPSPYLQQHAHNPVDWYPWGEEAFATARRDHKPVLLSVGYSACHWCHVMAHECFEDPAIAALMNERFVNIKVDREERPDVDHLYQTVCQLLTRSGGWPLTVFLTPAAEPYYAGTYFPPRPMYGRAGFPEILAALADAFHEQPDKVAEQVATLLAALASSQAVSGGGPLGTDLLEAAWRGLEPNFDREHGGFGGAPKFPNPFNLDLFLRQHARSGEALPLELVLQGCRAMRAGGVYDQLGGGFHRYSVDAAWTIPHFEKMLYDNALLPPVYLAAWQASGAPDLADTVRETLDYLVREMQSPAGGFYSTTDADSEGEEGRYFVWTPAQVGELLPPEDAALVCERFGITAVGNFEHGSTCLNVAAALPALAAARGWSEEATAGRLSAASAVLLAARSERVPPFRDEKILASWNGLAISALARAALLLADDSYLAAARRAACFVLEAMRPDPAHLCRSCKDGAARGDGFLDDYGNVALGLLDLFAADGDPRWCAAATALAETVLTEFADDAHGDFHMTRGAGERLIVRPKDQHDNAVPSGLSAAGHALWRLARLTEDERYHRAVERLLEAHAGGLRENPWGMANLLALLDDYLAEPESVVVVGHGAEADALVRAATAGYHPHRLVCRVPDPETPQLPSLLAQKGRPAGQPCAYVCRGRVCSAPLPSAELLLAQLAAS